MPRFRAEQRVAEGIVRTVAAQKEFHLQDLLIARPLPFGKETRGKSILASTLALLGGLSFRFALVLAGRESADDPEAYFTFASKENVVEPEDKI